MRDRKTGVAVVFSVVVALAACGGGDAGDSADLAEADTAMEAPVQPDQPAIRGYPAEATGGVAGVLGDEGTGEKVAVILTEFAVQLSVDSVGGGPTTFVIENRGKRPHTVEIYSEHYGRWRSAPIPPGGSGSMSMPLQFATYEVFCPMTEGSLNHKEKGMVATLRVQ